MLWLSVVSDYMRDAQEPDGHARREEYVGLHPLKKICLYVSTYLSIHSYRYICLAIGLSVYSLGPMSIMSRAMSYVTNGCVARFAPKM